MSVSKAMKSPDVGYSKRSAEKPQVVTRSKGFRELFAEVFTPEYLQKNHEELMNSKTVQHMPFHYKIKDDEIKEIINNNGFTYVGTKRFMVTAIVFFLAPDNLTRDKALDKAYKILGSYAPVKVSEVDPLLDVDDEELEAKLRENEEIANRASKFKRKKK